MKKWHLIFLKEQELLLSVKHMKIIKYTKMKSNKYKVKIDDIEVKLYDDVIVKYQLLRKKEITDEEINGIQ